MPELPEVETVARQLAPWLEGRQAQALRILDPRLKSGPVPRLPGRRVTEVGRSGKQVLIGFSAATPTGSPVWLAVHLRMTGRLIWKGRSERIEGDHLRARIAFDRGTLLFYDTRRFGTWTWHASRSDAAPAGVDPLAPSLTAAKFAAMIGGSRQNVKAWLMRQDRLVGLGNIYASEILHAAGVSPHRSTETLAVAEARRLYGATRRILRHAIARCGTTFPTSRTLVATSAPTSSTWRSTAGKGRVAGAAAEPSNGWFRRNAARITARRASPRRARVDPGPRGESWRRSGAPGLAVAALAGRRHRRRPADLGGFPGGHDWAYELVRVSEYRSSMEDGQLPPAWAPNLYGGYGSPIFLFYAPAFSFVATLLSFVTGSIERGATAALILLFVLALPATRRLGAALAGPSSPAAARVAVYLYLLNPYLLGDLFLRNADAEFTALCVAPWALAAMLAARENPKRAPLVLGIAFAAVIVSHNLTAVSIAAMLPVAALLTCRRDGGLRQWQGPVTGLVLGLALSAFFWVPALALKSLMRTDELIGGEFDFHLYFSRPAEIFGYANFFATGLLTPLVLLIGVGVVLRAVRARSPRAPLLLGALLGAALLLFLVTPASVGVWENLPLLPLFQFPWRMLGPVALLTAMVGALVFAELAPRWTPAARRSVELALLLLCVLNALPHLRDYRPIEPELRRNLAVRLSAETIRSQGLRATVGDEYLPQAGVKDAWRTRRPVTGPFVESTPPLVRAEAGDESGTTSALIVETRGASRIELARWFFPGWRVGIDGRPSAVMAGRFGSIEVDLPVGKSQVELRYRSPRVRRLALAFSAVAALLWLGLFFRSRPSP